jgi:hypothetical protein
MTDEKTQRCKMAAADWKRVRRKLRPSTESGRNVLDKITRADIPQMPLGEIVGIRPTAREYEAVREVGRCMSKKQTVTA